MADADDETLQNGKLGDKKGKKKVWFNFIKNDHGLFQITPIKSVLQLTTNLLILIIEKTQTGTLPFPL